MKNGKFIRSIIYIIIILLATTLFVACNKDETDVYTIKYTATEGGSVQGLTDQLVYAGCDATTVMAEPEPGYDFVMWSDFSTDAERTDRNVHRDIIVEAQFIRSEEMTQVFSLTYIAGEGGSLGGVANQSIIFGEDGDKITAIPNAGYRFVGWSDGVTQSSRIDQDVTSTITVTALFERITLKAIYNADIGGTIVGQREQTVLWGELSEQVCAIADDGYRFAGWSDGITSPARADLLEDDLRVTAFFEKIYHITYRAEQGGTINGQADQIVPAGRKTTYVQAIPQAGYIFTGWSDGVFETGRMDVADGDITYTAKFQCVYEETGTSSDPFIIDNVTDWQNMQYFCNGFFRLENDLDFADVFCTPIFSSDNIFSGELDGNEHTLTNITITQQNAYSSVLGVIGSTGVVKNLTIEGAKLTVPDIFTDSGIYVGIVAGKCNGFLNNIKVSGEISGENIQNGALYVGGITGALFGMAVQCESNININLSFQDKVIAQYFSAENIGGLSGILYGHCFNCRAAGKIMLVSDSIGRSDTRNIGGLIGLIVDNNTDFTLQIKDCITDIEIAANCKVTAGGLLGRAANTIKLNVDNCKASAAINTSVGNAGGLIGQAIVRTLQITGSSVECDIIAYSAGGFGYYLSGETVEQTTVQYCFVEGKVHAEVYAGGFAETIDGNISDCHTDVEVKGQYVGGFAAHISGTVRRCYTEGDIEGLKFAAGFVYSVWGDIMESYTTGTVTGYRIASGFLNSLHGEMKNCFSISDIYMPDSSEEVFIAGGLCSGGAGGAIKNSYYAGQITGSGKRYYVGAITGSTATIQNCHWLKRSDSICLQAAGWDNDPDAYDTYMYENFAAMQTITEQLNKGNETDVWVTVPDKLPELFWMIA